MSLPTIASLPAPSRPGPTRGGRNDSGAGDFAAVLDIAAAAQDRGDATATPEPTTREPATPSPTTAPATSELTTPSTTTPEQDPAATPAPALPDPTAPVAPSAAQAQAHLQVTAASTVAAQVIQPPVTSTPAVATATTTTAATAVIGATGPTVAPTTGEDATTPPAVPAVPSAPPDQAVTPTTGLPADQQAGQQTGQQPGSQPGQPGGHDAGTGRGVPLPEGMTAVPPIETTTAPTVVAPTARPESVPAAAATTAPVDGTSATGAPTTVRTLDAGPVAAAPQASRPPVVPDLAAQLVPRVASLRSLGEGVHRIVMRVQPEHIGAVRVVAEITADSVRIELHGGTEQAREALRAVLPELRRDLQGGDLPGQRAELDLGTAGRHGQRAGADGQGSSSRNPAVPAVLDPTTPVELVLSRVPAGRLDVLT